MAPYRNSRAQSAETRGAAAGSVLRGTRSHNHGLRLRVLHDHPRGGGPIKGGFVILDAGDNMHAHLLARMVGGVTTADEVLRIIRRGCPGCVSVVNASILAPDEASGARMPAMAGRN
jgi:hypothetical protein